MLFFKPSLDSVRAKKQRALSVFEQTKTQLAEAIEEFRTVIGNATEEINKYQEKISAHQADVSAAHKEIVAAQVTINKINSIVGA